VIHPENARLLADLELFVVATPDNQARFDLRPFGLIVADDALFDPLRREAAPFLDRLARLDAVAFGPEEMPMPRWVFYDCAEIPGGIVGFGARAATISSDVRALLEVPRGYEGVVPLGMYIAIPTLDPGVWMGHNLSTVTRFVGGGALRGLGGLTKAVALKVFRASAQIGVTQWDSAALFVHTRMGPLELLTAWTPAHSHAASLTYRATIDDAALLRLARAPGGEVARPPADRWIDSGDHAAIEALQARIEAGERFCVVGPPTPIGPGRQLVPIAALARR
jgi:hypothetical protein